MTAGDISKQASVVLFDSLDDLKAMYSKQKADIDNSLKFAPGIYTGAISMMYAVLQAPPTLFSRIFGTVPGMVFQMFYQFLIFPYSVVLKALDLRTLKNLVSTILYFVIDCLPSFFTNLIQKIFSTLASFFDTTAKAIRGQKMIAKLRSRQMLTESKCAMMEIKIWDWFKGVIGKIASKAKDAAWSVIKTGLSIVEKPFMAIVYPLTQCMAKVNKLGGSANPGALSASAIANPGIIKVATMMGIAATSSVVVSLSGFLWVIGVATFVFTVATYLNMVGQFVEFKNMISDAFS